MPKCWSPRFTAANFCTTKTSPKRTIGLELWLACSNSQTTWPVNWYAISKKNGISDLWFQSSPPNLIGGSQVTAKQILWDNFWVDSKKKPPKKTVPSPTKECAHPPWICTWRICDPQQKNPTIFVFQTLIFLVGVRGDRSLLLSGWTVRKRPRPSDMLGVLGVVLPWRYPTNKVFLQQRFPQWMETSSPKKQASISKCWLNWLQMTPVLLTQRTRMFCSLNCPKKGWFPYASNLRKPLQKVFHLIQYQICLKVSAKVLG